MVLPFAFACCCLMVLYVLLHLLLWLHLLMWLQLLLSLPSPPPATSQVHFPPAASFCCGFTAAVVAEGSSPTGPGDSPDHQDVGAGWCGSKPDRMWWDIAAAVA